MLDTSFLTDDERAELMELVAARFGWEPLIDFVMRVTPRLPPPPHMRPIIELWERTLHEQVFAVIEMPPRHAKTTYALNGLVRNLQARPASLNAFATYAGRYARSRSRIARGLALNAGINLDPAMANLDEWRTTFGGGMLFAGFEGAWNGQGVDGVGVVDDPYKSRAEANSKVIKENVADFFWQTFMLRFEGSSYSVLVQHTRWCEDDLIGTLLVDGQGFPWEHIRLPAIAEENDLLGRMPGEPLWPERVSLDRLMKLKASIGTYAFNALFQQRPAPIEGSIFKRNWWRFYKTGIVGAPRPFGSTTVEAVPMPDRFDQVVLSIDATFKDSSTSDNVGFLIAGQKGRNLFLLDDRTKRMGFNATIAELLRAVKDYRITRILIEDKANGPAIIDTLKAKIPGIIAINPRGGKESRAMAIEPDVESGGVLLPEGAHWNEAFIEELAQFPNGANDDRVDALSQMLIYLLKSNSVHRASMLAIL